VTVAREEEKLRLGKGAAFVKGRLKRLRQEDETWEADFQALPKPITQSETHYLGMVVNPDGSFLADSQVEGRPTVNDMATLLAHAMRRPLTGEARVGSNTQSSRRRTVSGRITSGYLLRLKASRSRSATDQRKATFSPKLFM
jgi:hypothetical protein